MNITILGVKDPNPEEVVLVYPQGFATPTEAGIRDHMAQATVLPVKRKNL